MKDLAFPLRSVFLALPLEGNAREEFLRLQELLKPFLKLFSFQNPESPHLTLTFWKELMEIEYGDVLRRAEIIAKRTKPFSVKIVTMETFSDRVLLLTLAFSVELATLKKLCPWPNEKPFSPHITLARMRNPNAFRVHRKKIGKILKHISFEIPFDRLRLYAEINGRKQTPLQDFPFASG